MCRVMVLVGRCFVGWIFAGLWVETINVLWSDLVKLCGFERDVVVPFCG